MDDKSSLRSRMSRRDTLKILLGIGLTLGVGRFATATDPRQILKRKIPGSGEALPAIGLGTARTFDIGPDADEHAQRREVLRLFVEGGGTLVDSSPMYGAAESVVGQLATELGAHRSLFLATKVWTRGRDAGIQQMERSMRLLGSERVDLMQVHNLVDWQTHLPTLRDWKERGRIRYLGITHYRVDAFDELERLMRKHELDFVQFNYSIATRDAERRLLPLAAERGIATLINKPFENAALFNKVRGHSLPSWTADFDCTSWAQFFLKFILSHPDVTCTIPATRKPKHLIDNMRAGLGRLPDADERRRMIDHLERL